MSIPTSFLEELRARIPLSDIVGRRIPLQRAGREWKSPCPFHAEKTPSFYVNDQKSFFHCFGCGAHGDAVGFLMRHDGLAFPEAVEQLAALAGLEMPRPEPAEREKYDRLKLLADALEAAAKWFEAQLRSSAGREALAYLTRRGLEEQSIAEFRLGYAPASSDALRAALVGQGHSEADLIEIGLIRRPDDGRSPYAFFRNRVMFPVTDKRGRVIAFGGRIMEGEGPKYVNSPEHALFHKGTVLYGLARARAAIAKGDRPIVVEGYMDVIAMQCAGFGGAVAPLGTALSEAQLGELWKAQGGGDAAKPPVLCFDGDNAGRRAAVRAVERVLPLLGPSHTVSVAFLPQGDDPDSLIRHQGAAAMGRALDTAWPLVDAVWEFTAESRTLDTPEQRAGFKADLLTQVGSIADRSVQNLYRDELMRRFDEKFPRFTRQFRGKSDKPFAGIAKPPAVRQNATLKARIVIAAMVNHPYLFEEWAEAFAEIPVPSAWQGLRLAVFEALSSETLDSAALENHLRASGYGAEFDDIMGPATLGHAKFVAPEASEDKVRSGWLDVLKPWAERARDGDEEKSVQAVDPHVVEADQRHATDVLNRNPVGGTPRDRSRDFGNGSLDSRAQEY